MKIDHAVLAPSVPSGAGALAAAAPPSGREWSSLVERTETLLKGGSERRGAVAAQAGQLSEMIRLQIDVCRYQARVELASKVAESGVATVRKFQQGQ